MKTTSSGRGSTQDLASTFLTSALLKKKHPLQLHTCRCCTQCKTEAFKLLPGPSLPQPVVYSPLYLNPTPLHHKPLNDVLSLTTNLPTPLGTICRGISPTALSPSHSLYFKLTPLSGLAAVTTAGQRHHGAPPPRLSPGLQLGRPKPEVTQNCWGYQLLEKAREFQRHHSSSAGCAGW